MEIEELLLILNTIIYAEEIIDRDTIVNHSIYELATTGVLDIAPNNFFPQSEWDAVLKTIKKEKEVFSKIRIVDMDQEEGKQKNVCFENQANNETYVVFKGTDALEWHDNAQGGSSAISDTAQQKQAESYISCLANEKGYHNIIVSGHSKGGNKAQYVAIVSDEVQAAYSFNGQGMGEGFLYQYREEIEKNRYKITNINASNDFVSVLFDSVAGTTKYTPGDTSVVELLASDKFTELAYQHSPMAMFTVRNGYAELRPTTGQRDETIVFVGNFLQICKRELSDEDFELLTHLVMHQFESEGCSENFSMDAIPEGFYKRVLAVITLQTKKAEFSTIEMACLGFVVLGLLPELASKKLGPVFGNSIRILDVYGYLGTRKVVNKLVKKTNVLETQVSIQQNRILDFSSATQEQVIKHCFGNRESHFKQLHRNIDWLLQVIPISDTEVLWEHHSIKNRYDAIVSSLHVYQQQYLQKMSAIYALDSTQSKRIKALTKNVQKYRTFFKS